MCATTGELMIERQTLNRGATVQVHGVGVIAKIRIQPDRAGFHFAYPVDRPRCGRDQAVDAAPDQRRVSAQFSNRYMPR